MNFSQFKAEWSLHEQGDDYFSYEAKCDCNEAHFADWLANQNLFKRKFAISGISALNCDMPENKWHFFSEHYVRKQMKAHVTSLYPEGFFEAIRKGDRNDVAALLPEPSNQNQYRISYYKPNGPVSHNVYNTRQEALEKLAHAGYRVCEGALDALLHTDVWNRGLYICKWLSLGIHPTEGLQQEKDNVDVQQLFAEDLKRVCS